jgi:cytochrome c oxidase assembly protein subunit 15
LLPNIGAAFFVEVPLTVAAAATLPASRTPADRLVAYWLVALAGMILLMVVIGGVTRLTESGLSITEWKPVSGVLPPLTEAGWVAAFESYKQIPEYSQVHFGMTLEEFKQIFFWEYAHRLWGRLIGLAAIVPLLVFLVQRRIPGASTPRFLAVPVLIGLQGALGWYMVKSGLVARTSVSQYRLTAHLALAVLIYGYVIWLAADILRSAPLRLDAILARRLRHAARAVLGLVCLTLLAGGFMAGLKAGLTYNTFPLMDGRVVPDGYFIMRPWWINPFENVTAVQFDHRCLALASFAAVGGFWLASRRVSLPRSVRLPLDLMLGAVVLQVALGVATLVLVVPVPLAAAHQAGAVLLFTCALLAVHGLKPERVSQA